MPWVAIAGLAISAFEARNRIRNDQKAEAAAKKQADDAKRAAALQAKQDAAAAQQAAVVAPASSSSGELSFAGLKGPGLIVAGGLAAGLLLLLVKRR